MQIQQIKLQDFKPGERILMVARRHWFVFLRDAVGLLVLFFIPFFFLPIVAIFISAGLSAGATQIPAGIGFFFASLWALILWQILFARWTNYFFDIWIITNWRIIDIEQKALFRRNVSTLFNLSVIQDITVEQNGIIATFLNFGTIQIQTSAAQREFVMDDIARPKDIERTVRKAQQEQQVLHG